VLSDLVNIPTRNLYYVEGEYLLKNILIRSIMWQNILVFWIVDSVYAVTLHSTLPTAIHHKNIYRIVYIYIYNMGLRPMRET
jgi:sulfur relay (sulfurtransferase) DsrF/TusC family protein